MTFSDQSWPCPCDWNGDGVTDLLIGGGYGWRELCTTRANERPVFSEGKPIRLQRDEILRSRHPHNMGYPYPSYV